MKCRIESQKKPPKKPHFLPNECSSSEFPIPNTHKPNPPKNLKTLYFRNRKNANQMPETRSSALRIPTLLTLVMSHMAIPRRGPRNLGPAIWATALLCSAGFLTLMAE